MSYFERKRMTERQLIASLHGGGEDFVPGLSPIVVSTPDPRRYLQEPQPVDEREPGWGPSYSIEDGAQLIFGDIAR